MARWGGDGEFGTLLRRVWKLEEDVMQMNSVMQRLKILEDKSQVYENRLCAIEAKMTVRDSASERLAYNNLNKGSSFSGSPSSEPSKFWHTFEDYLAEESGIYPEPLENAFFFPTIDDISIPPSSLSTREVR